jgi:pimeloyl-ACP methyl ester carboxylesterase
MSRVTVNGVQIYYELTGRGETPLVLVHGSWGSHHTWDAFVPLLEEAYSILDCDLRG